jgi:predicted transcriptional regulator with HTH domain
MLVLISCGNNISEKEIIKGYIKTRIEYVKSDKYLKAKDTSEVEKALRDIDVNYLGKFELGEMEFATIMEKNVNDVEINKLNEEYEKAWNEAFAKQMQNSWKKK